MKFLFRSGIQKEETFGSTEIKTLSEAIKTSTSLTKLVFRCKQIKTGNKNGSEHATITLSHHINRQPNWRHGSNIVEWIIEIKHNNHWTRSDEWRQKKEDTQKHKPIIYPFFLLSSTGNWIGDSGVTSLSESLKKNTTLIELNLNSKQKTKGAPKEAFFHNKHTGNHIEATGAQMLSEMLVKNTSLTALQLRGKLWMTCTMTFRHLFTPNIQ